jgi:hypothetical protein
VDERLGHLLAVGADVLDRRGAGVPRDPREALDAGEIAAHRPRDEIVPADAGVDVDELRRERRDRRRAQAEDEAVEPAIGDEFEPPPRTSTPSARSAAQSRAAAAASGPSASK